MAPAELQEEVGRLKRRVLRAKELETRMRDYLKELEEAANFPKKFEHTDKVTELLNWSHALTSDLEVDLRITQGQRRKNHNLSW